MDPTTQPDPLDPNAAEELDLLSGEGIARCWRVPLGYLVMTNLRCLYVWRKALVLRPSGWEVGPTFFFFNLTPPRVVARRFVELREGTPVDARTFRFLVHDPTTVCAEITAALPAGQAEWQARRERAQVRGPPPDELAQRAPGAVVVREIVKIRCRYCGNLMDEVAPTCPACGAPQ